MSPGAVLLNEVLACSKDYWHKPLQFVELKTMGGVAISLSGWSLKDENDTWTLGQSVEVAPGGYALLVLQGWPPSVPDGVPVVVLINRWKDLDPTGGRLELMDPRGVTVDRISWGDDTSVFNPAIPVPPCGQSLSRQPDGADTDSAADFAAQAPSPGLSNEGAMTPAPATLTPTPTSSPASLLTITPMPTSNPIPTPTETPTATPTETVTPTEAAMPASIAVPGPSSWRHGT